MKLPGVSPHQLEEEMSFALPKYLLEVSQYELNLLGSIAKPAKINPQKISAMNLSKTYPSH